MYTLNIFAFLHLLATLYVVHEHLTCEVLDNVIGYGQQEERESKFLDHLILDTKTSSYATDVLEGMEFIQSYGVRHLTYYRSDLLP